MIIALSELGDQSKDDLRNFRESMMSFVSFVLCIKGFYFLRLWRKSRPAIGPLIKAFHLSSTIREEAFGLSGAVNDCKKPLENLSQRGVKFKLFQTKIIDASMARAVKRLVAHTPLHQ